jgi:3-oxoacyl-[acyl-carrier protein] reductase
MRLLEGKAAVITGSGRGIGRSVAKLFSQHGARVVVNDLDEDCAQQVAAEICSEGEQAVACQGNVTADDFPERLMNTVISHFGRLDIIVNNAGYTWDAVVHNMSDEAWDAMLAVHLTAPFRIIRAASSYLRETAKQEIAKVNVSIERLSMCLRFRDLREVPGSSITRQQKWEWWG